MLLLFSVRMAGDRLFGMGLFVRFAVCVSRGRLSIFPFWFWGGMWDLMILIPARYLSIYFVYGRKCQGHLCQQRSETYGEHLPNHILLTLYT